MSRFARRKDVNHNLLAEAFIKLGYSVVDTSRLGDDFPDILVARRGQIALIEIKAEKGKMTDGQWTFYKNFPGLIFICKTIEDVMRIDGIMKQEAVYRQKGFGT